MKKALALMAIVLSLGLTVAMDAEAKRLGGGKSAGMQRQNVTAPSNTPGAPANVAPAAGTSAAAAAPAAAAAGAKRSWMGPIAGLAAGLGLAALASHLGFGEGLANMLMIGLLVMAVLAAVTFFMRKRAAAQAGSLAGAGGLGNLGRPQQPQDMAYRQAQAPQQAATGGSMIGSRLIGGGAGLATDGTRVGSIPAGFDTASFERNAKDQFMALQAANDAKDLDRLRDYLTPEMFEAARADIAERGDAVQKTDVFGLEAKVLDVAEEGDLYVVSVRFTGSTREQHGADTDTLDEMWHLVKPRQGFGGWMIAGIQQNA